jgi:alkylhydroperoxidase/carboxymuconolactone decarboxylase family protein YurZ
MDKREKRLKSEKLIQEALKHRGYIFPEWEHVCRSDPDFFETYNKLYAISLGKKGRLSIKVKEFIALGILAFKGSPTDVLTLHIQRAIKNGATRAEILEAFETMICEGGAPTFFNGVKALLNLDKKSKN